ncbi:MAG: hypothetical protein K2M82_06125 [Lachnospiraceae bacterium]|nr:hypothetical protein [Lachnospiraceae bacterium]
MKFAVKALAAAVLSTAVCTTGFALTQNDNQVDDSVVSESRADLQSDSEIVEINKEAEMTSSSSSSSSTASKRQNVSEIKEENSVVIRSDGESEDVVVEEIETRASYDEEVVFDEQTNDNKEQFDETPFDEGEYAEIIIDESTGYDCEIIYDGDNETVAEVYQEIQYSGEVDG